MIRAARRLLVVAILGSGLTGCALLPFIPGPEPEDADVVVGASDSEGAPVDERCADLELPDAVADLWDGPYDQTGFPHYGTADWSLMHGTMLVQSDALICLWTDSSGEPVISLIAIGEADDGYRLSEPAYAEEDSYIPVPLADGAYVGCWTDQSTNCHWNVLSGSTWVSVILSGLPSDAPASASTPGSGLSALVETLASLSADLRLPAIPSSGSDFERCLSTITPESIASAYGIDAGRVSLLSMPAVDGSIFESHPDFGEMMAPYVMNRLGFSKCGVVVDESVFAIFIIAPEAAWVLEDPNAQRPEPVEIAGRGLGLDGCERSPLAPDSEELTLCILATSVGEDLYIVELHPYASEMYPLGEDEPARAATWTLIDALIG
jgi:hypothetical protein